MDIFATHNVRRGIESTTWNTLLVLGLALQQLQDWDQEPEGSPPWEGLDQKKIGDEVERITGKGFRSSGSYNRVFSHLSRLRDAGLIQYNIQRSKDRAFFDIRTFARYLGEELQSEGLMPYFLSKRSKRSAYSILVLMAMRAGVRRTRSTNQMVSVAHLSRITSLSEGQVRLALRRLRKGLEVYQDDRTSKVFPPGLVTLVAPDTWELNTQGALTLPDPQPQLVQITEPVPAKPVGRVLTVRHQRTLKGDPAIDDLEALLDNGSPLAGRMREAKQYGDPAVAKLTPADLDEVSVERKPPEPASDPTVANLTAADLGNAKHFRSTQMPAGGFELDPQFKDALDEEAAFLGLKSSAEVLGFYLNNEWLPALLQTQAERAERQRQIQEEQEEQEERERLLIEQQFAARRADVSTSEEILRQDSAKIEELASEMRRTLDEHSLRSAQVRDQREALVQEEKQALEALRGSIHDNRIPA